MQTFKENILFIIITDPRDKQFTLDHIHNFVSDVVELKKINKSGY